jgi:UDP-glucose 4-epimerase
LDRLHGLRYAILRYFNAAGASDDRGEDHDPELHLIPNVLRAAQFGNDSGPLTIYGDDYPTPDGTCVRDYIHVADLADAHILALEALGKGSRVYNLGNGRGFSVRQVIDAAQRVTGRPIPALVGPRRPGDPAILVANSRKIRRELGWQPRYADLDEIVASAWRWRQRHPAGYGDRTAMPSIIPLPRKFASRAA